MKTIPLNDHVLVKPDEKKEDVTPAGIYVAPQKNQEPRTGEVVAIAEGVKQVVVGNRVYFREFAGESLDNGEYLVIPADDLLLKWKGEDGQ